MTGYLIGALGMLILVLSLMRKSEFCRDIAQELPGLAALAYTTALVVMLWPLALAVLTFAFFIRKAVQ